MSKIEKYVEYMLQVANDNRHGYDQVHRWGPDYDCSALVITALEQAGIPAKTKGATYTGNMKPVLLSIGFSNVISTVNTTTGAGLLRGDILLKQNGHTAVYIGNGQLVHASINEKGTIKGGKTGDQTGKEICVRSYYNKPWDSVLRYTEYNKENNNKKDADTVAREVIAGKWGNGADRKNRLLQAGYDYNTIQARVNQIIRGY